MSEQHARYAPSSASKWINCPGYVQLVENVVKEFGEEKSSEAAQEGTEAHVIAAEILESRNPTRALRAADIDQELHDCLWYYVDIVEGFLDGLDKQDLNPALCVEKRVGSDGQLYGTADCIISHDDGIIIVDYKHGKGVYVDADSWQLKVYGFLAICEEYGGYTEALHTTGQVTLCVVQPRYIEKGVPLTRSVVYEIKDFMQRFGALIVEALNRNAEEELRYFPGEHCTFCYAKALCPQKQEVIKQALQIEEDDLKDLEKLKFILDNEKEIYSIVKKTKALALTGLENGMLDPEALGYGLAKQIGNRVWAHPKGEEGLAPLLRSHGVDKKTVWVRKLISPAQAEKLVDDKKWLTKYVERPEKGVKLVPLNKADPELTGRVAAQLDAFQEKETQQRTLDPEDF